MAPRRVLDGTVVVVVVRVARDRPPRSQRPPRVARSRIITSPPTNWLRANRQPSTTSTMPSSSTRLVEANMKTVAATKSAPLTTRDRAMAVAA